MKLELIEQQKKKRQEFRDFVDEEVVPYGDKFDREESIPPKLIKKLAQKGYLGALLPQKYGGMKIEQITY
ncbi:MAG: acyl-CoA dehydrogenase family protein, partial [Spirulinaceae cyanobacterium]